MKIKNLFIAAASILFMGVITPVLAGDERFDRVGPPVSVDELRQIRGGMMIPELKEIIDARPQSVRDDLARVKLRFPNSPAPPEKPEKITISLPDFDAVRALGIGVRHRNGLALAHVSNVRRTALQQGRVLLDSD